MLPRALLRRAAAAAPLRTTVPRVGSVAVRARALGTDCPPAASPEEVTANLGVDHHEGALDHLFQNLDADGDGLIQPAELRAGLKGAGLAIDDRALAKLTEAYGDGAGNLEMAGLLELLSGIKEHRFHTFEKPAPAGGAPAPPPAETHYVFSDVGHFEGAIDLAFNEISSDRGAIEPEDLLAALSARGVRATPDQLKGLFALYDKTGTGTLELVEFAAICGELKADEFD